MTGRVICGVLAIVLMFFALLFAGAGGAFGAGVTGQFVAPNLPTTAGRAIGGTVPPPPPGTTVRTSTELLPGVPLGGYGSSFPSGQCTSWAALNHPVSWNGDAYQWFSHAQLAGVATSQAPSVGAIVVYVPLWPYYDAQFGHVAIVTDVGLGTYTVSEMNYVRHGLGVVDARTIVWPDSRVEGFIP